MKLWLSIVALAGLAAPLPAAAQPSATATRAEESCTQQWRRHGHTNQTEAKAFGRQCLAAAGATALRLSESEVLALLEQAIGADHPLSRLEPVDAATFCAGYVRFDANRRARFWRTMLTRMARQESAFAAAEPYWEAGQRQYSIGLLQLSLSDEGRYRCGLRSEVDLTDPVINLRCGASIMAQLVEQYGRIGGDLDHWDQGGAAYWSTLRAIRPGTTRPDGAPPRDSRRAVIEATTSLPGC